MSAEAVSSRTAPDFDPSPLRISRRHVHCSFQTWPLDVWSRTRRQSPKSPPASQMNRIDRFIPIESTKPMVLQGVDKEPSMMSAQLQHSFIKMKGCSTGDDVNLKNTLGSISHQWRRFGLLGPLKTSGLLGGIEAQVFWPRVYVQVFWWRASPAPLPLLSL